MCNRYRRRRSRILEMTGRRTFLYHFPSGRVRKHSRRLTVRDNGSTLAVAPKGGKCSVTFVTKTIAVVTSDCWLLKVGVKIERSEN